MDNDQNKDVIFSTGNTMIEQDGVWANQNIGAEASEAVAALDNRNHELGQTAMAALSGTYEEKVGQGIKMIQRGIDNPNSGELENAYSIIQEARGENNEKAA